MRKFAAWSAIGATLLTGCASFDGRGLVAGKSTATEVAALMGAPSQTVALPNGDKALYFSRLPAGRAMYVVTVSSDGVMKSIEQRLTRQNLSRIVAGESTRRYVRELLGPPGLTGRLALQPREWWEYKLRDNYQKRIVWVQFSDDGLVREVLDLLDPEEFSPGDGRGGHGN
ncbi:MAG: outer membrane protein assembly factor BamE [Betaproteobacteria bacterium]|nr:outer membrane protein assembly factor BamE [Betaproteobacteria bacterium]